MPSHPVPVSARKLGTSTPRWARMEVTPRLDLSIGSSTAGTTRHPLGSSYWFCSSIGLGAAQLVQADSPGVSTANQEGPRTVRRTGVFLLGISLIVHIAASRTDDHNPCRCAVRSPESMTARALFPYRSSRIKLS